MAELNKFFFAEAARQQQKEVLLKNRKDSLKVGKERTISRK